LDQAGSLLLTWIPPDESYVKITTEVPKPSSETSNGEKLSFIQTRYPVNLDYAGNVIILNSSGNRLPTVSSSVTKGYYVTAQAGNYSRTILEYPPVPGSISVSVDNKILTETFSANPESDQFYVDY